MKFNICFIGGGSKLWAITLMKDLSVARDLEGTIRLYDIHQANAETNVKLGNRIFGHASPGKPSFRITAEQRVENALEGADFVILSLEPGPIEVRYSDLVLPEEYGILQSVGDTIGPGGIFRARRSIPIFRHYARMIRKHAPKAWVINYTNPMTLCTRVLYESFPEIKAFGCCHEVYGTRHLLKGMLADLRGIETAGPDDILVNSLTFLPKSCCC